MPEEAGKRPEKMPLPIRSTTRNLLMTEHDQIYLEALLLVACARLAIIFCFRSIAPWVLKVRPAGSPEPSAELQQQVQMALESVGRWMPWENLCLPSAIAGKVILARRGFPATIHLGVGHRASGMLRAHAWLEAGSNVLVGGENTDTVTLIPR